ncbi:HEAT repeat domain-containing protein [Clostridium sp.]|uniref:HEAT repeat domain-containing protein n=1 Tax=Clostridium sp. TaxID=1506 RepID=UPI0039E98A1B
MKKYDSETVFFIKSAVNKIVSGQDIDCDMLENIKKQCKNKYKREIIKKRLLYYIKNFKGDFSQSITKLSEYIGIIQYDINSLRTRNYHEKALAAKRLGEFRSNSAIEALLREIDTKDNDVKYNILLALAKIGEEESFIKVFENIDSSIDLSEISLIEIVDSFEGDKNNIYKCMINSDNNFTACVFIKLAGNYKNISLSKNISKYLFSKDKERKIAAVEAIGNMGDVRYLDYIIKLLEDSEWEVRSAAAKALNNFTDSKVLIPLAKSLSDSQWNVRYNAALSLSANQEGMNIISHIFKGEDKFAKDIILSTMESLSGNELYLYENPEEHNKRSLVTEIKKYMVMKKEEEVYEYRIS